MSIGQDKYFEGKDMGLVGTELTDYVEQETYREVKEKMAFLVDATNYTGSHDLIVKAMLDGLMSEHRHLQGEFVKALQAVVIGYGATDRYDGRNEYAVQMCARMGVASEAYGKSPEEIKLALNVR